NIIYIIFGIILSSSLFLLMIRLKISLALSSVLTVLFVVSPSCVLYENWLFYTYPVMTLLCLSALFLHRFLSSTKILDGVLFFTLLSIISLIRSLFHISWFILLLVIILVYQRRHWKKIVAVAFIPLMAIFLLYIKNLYLFGSF